MTSFSSKLALFQTGAAFKQEDKPSSLKPTNTISKSTTWRTNRSTEPHSNHSTKITLNRATDDDEKVDEYAIWTQFVDHKRKKPSSAFELSAFTKQTDSVPSISMNTAKSIFKKYRNTEYQPAVMANAADIPKKLVFTPIQSQFVAPPTRIAPPNKILFQPAQPQTISSTPFHGLANKKEFSTGICQVCLEEKQDIITTHACNHKLCKSCMRRYIKLAPDKMSIQCPEFKCGASLSQFFDIKLVLSHPEYAEIYLKKLVNNLSRAAGRDARIFCLTETCFNQVYETDIPDGKLDCHECNSCWCIRCNSPWHAGLSCDEAFQDRQSQMSNILLNCPVKTIGYVQDVPVYRVCPNCGEGIEHTVGCKHMNCIKCEQSFCFVCLEVCDSLLGWKCGGSSDVCPIAPRQ